MASDTGSRTRGRATRPLPVGTLTFLMTDVEGSTRFWDASPRTAQEAIARHTRIIEEHVERNQGQIVESGREGDSVLAVFRQATDAVMAAVSLQRAMLPETWPSGVDIRVRVGVNSGEAELKGGHYVGIPLYRCARLMAAGHGGQILISQATEQLVADLLPEGVALRELGEHPLKDLSRGEHVYQVLHSELPSEFPPLRSEQPVKGNLHVQLTTFVGRHAEVRAVSAMLKSSRLVTLLGPGGIGKSRLAVEVAQSSLHSWPDGVWWIDLAPLREPDQVAAEVASTLHVQGLGPAVERVISWLARKQMLLLLDNCEHLIDACADFCRRSLARDPGVSIVATSREPLGVEGEVRWPVPPLKVVEAVALFEERGRLVMPAFKVSSSNHDEIAQICGKVDELPLAIELAASRLSMLSPHEISTQLSDRFRLLSAPRSEDPRHRTMTATIDWSYRLLTDAEAALFRRVSVFRGGFSLEAAEATCGDAGVPDVFAGLAGLVAKSMVFVEGLEDGMTRYRLLDSQSDFASARLTASGEEDEIRSRHYDYFEAALRSRTAGLTGPMAAVTAGLADWRWKHREALNAWAAVRWARKHRVDKGLPLAANLAFGAGVGDPEIVRSRQWLEELIHEGLDVMPDRIAALTAAANLAFMQGDYEAADRLARRVIEITRPEPKSNWREARALGYFHLGSALEGKRLLAEARVAFETGLDLVKNSTNERIKTALWHGIAIQELYAGRPEVALEILERCMVTINARGDPSQQSAFLESMANAELGLGHVDAAERNWKRSLDGARETYEAFTMIACIGGLSRTASARGDPTRAMRLAGAHAALCETWVYREAPYWADQLDAAIAISRQKLGDKRSREAWDQGAAMDLEHVVSYALEDVALARDDTSGLSRREVEVATRIAAGMSNREIGETLFLSKRTVEGHVDRIRNKLGLRSRTELAAWAVDHGLTAAGSGGAVESTPPKSRGARR